MGNIPLVKSFLKENAMSPESSLQNRLEQALDHRNIKPKTLSLKAGLNETAIRDILKGRSQNPRTDTVRKIAEALHIRPEWLLNGFGSMAEDAVSGGQFAESGAPAPSAGKIPVFATPSFDPVWSYRFDFSAPVDFAPALSLLDNVPKAYALYVADTKMVPRYFVGEILYIHPARPVQIGDDCLLIHQNGKGVVGKLDKQDANGVYLSFYNDENRVFVVHREVSALCPVVASLKA